MTQDTQIVLPFARLRGKNLQADFAGGTLSSDGGVLFFREISDFRKPLKPLKIKGVFFVLS